MIMEYTWMHFIDDEMLDYNQLLSDTVLACMAFTLTTLVSFIQSWDDMAKNYHSILNKL